MWGRIIGHKTNRTPHPLPTHPPRAGQSVQPQEVAASAANCEGFKRAVVWGGFSLQVCSYLPPTITTALSQYKNDWLGTRVSVKQIWPCTHSKVKQIISELTALLTCCLETRKCMSSVPTLPCFRTACGECGKNFLFFFCTAAVQDPSWHQAAF